MKLSAKILGILTLSIAMAIPQEAAASSEFPVEAFAQLPVIRGAQLSPNGTHFAYFRPFEGRDHLIIQSLDGAGRPTVVPPAENTELGWLHWGNDERLVFTVVASRKRNRTETTETRLWAINRDGSGAEHIVRQSTTSKTGSNLGRQLAHAQLQGNVIHWLPDEPNHIMVSLDGDHNEADEVRKIDIRDGTFDIVRDDYPGIQAWMPDHEGRLRIGWGYRNSTLKIMTIDPDGMWRSADKATWWDAGYFPQGFSADRDIAYMRGPDENGFMVVRTMNIDTGEFLETIFAKEGIDAGSLVVDPLTRWPVGVQYTEHLPAIEYFDEALANLQASIDNVLPDTSNEMISFTSDRQKVLIHSVSDVDPGTFAYLNRDTGQLGFLAEAMPGLVPEMMSPVEPVRYVARDGLAIPAYLIVPKGKTAEKLEVVVLPHGGPGARDDRSFSFLTQFLASRGYAVFQPNFRGSEGFGRAFANAGLNEWGGKMQEDVTDGVQWLIDQGIANVERVCIVGWSYGGYSAAIGAVQTPDLYRCAASINGVLDLPRQVADDNRYIGGSAWTRHIGLEDEKLKTVSPYHQAERIQIPMLIVQAKDDTRVHADQGQRMTKRLERLDKPVEYVEVEFGGHSMTNADARLVILQSLEKFLEENLRAE